MGIKRPWESEANGHTKGAKKIKVNPELVQVWEKLADNDETVRLEAAYDLISNHFKNASDEDAQKLLARLFRGLCSTRKCARPGFFAALVGVLSQNQKQDPVKVSLPSILSLLEEQTTAKAETFKQDEKDHHYGRLLGIKAVFDSGILEQSSGSDWVRILDSLCILMTQKPWIRAQAGSILCGYISMSCNRKGSSPEKIILPALKQLKMHKLLKTIDGLSIWLTAQNYLSNAKLPTDTWKTGNPLHTSEIQSLKRILLDKKVTTVDADDEELTGAGVWSPRLSVAWQLILQRLGCKSVKGDAPFQEFWQEVVEDGIFHPSSSPERKLTGILIFETALQEVKTSLITTCFSKNVMACQIQALKSSEEAYLRKAIVSTFENTKQYYQEHRSNDIDELIKGYLIGTGFIDFDTFTQTKFVQSLFDLAKLKAKNGIVRNLLDYFQNPEKVSKTGTNILAIRKVILLVLQRAINSDIRTLSASSNDSKALERIRTIVIEIANITSTSSRENLNSKTTDEDIIKARNDCVSNILETLVTTGVKGSLSFIEIVESLREWQPAMDENIAESVNRSWGNFRNFTSRARKHHATESKQTLGSDKLSSDLGLSLMFALVLYEIQQGDTDSVEMVDEMNAMADDFIADGASKIADAVADFVMALVSKPSKLNRKIGGLVFESVTNEITSQGLSALIDVITTKENQEGQQTLFEQEDINGGAGSDTSEQTNEQNDDSDSDTDSDSIGSDVEVLDAADDEVNSGDTSSASQDSEATESDSEADDEELNSFEKALAAALGTRKFNETDLGDINDEISESSDTSSDSDMSDSQMMALDSKLAEVFRNQQHQVSAQKQRKEQARNAKENTINLKNRALDLIEVYLRSQQQNRGLECAELLDAILEMARTTATPQLTTRGLAIVKTYIQKTKSASKMPHILTGTDARQQLRQRLTSLYEAIYAKDATNAFIDTAGQVHIFLSKLLTRAGEEDIKHVTEELSGRRTSKNDTRRKAVGDFWARFDAWVISTLDAATAADARNATKAPASSTIPKQKTVKGSLLERRANKS